jgi:hypothetical protein
MSLKLTDVGGLTIDDAAAKFPTGTITVGSDGPTRLGFTHLSAGTPVSVNGRRVTSAAADGAASVRLDAGTSTVVLGAVAAGGRPAPFSCGNPTGRLTTTSLGPVKLGMTRAQARRRFSRGSTRGRRDMDFFCPARRGIRVGYASKSLLRPLSGAQRRRFNGRVVLVLTANRHYALRGVRPDTRLSKVAKKLHAGRAFSVGRNRWYLVRDGSGRGVLKVQHGVIQEVGIAGASLVPNRAAARRFFRSFD